MRSLILIGLIGSLAWPARADDVVLQWNSVMLDALRVGDPAMPGPCWATRNMAMVHTAVFDAVNSVDRIYHPYKINLVAPAGASKEAAAAQAAHDVLLSLYPGQAATFNAALTTSLAGIPEGLGKSQGISVGSAVAAGIVGLRASDHATDPTNYSPTNAPGHWQPAPPIEDVPALGPGWGAVTPFCLPSGSMFRPAPPPLLSSAEYAAAFNEVKSLGAKNSVTRTPEQTEIGVFWGYDRAGMGTPPALYNQIAQQIAQQAGNSLEENARLFALINIAQADAGVAAWEAKYVYDLWRPIMAIRQADNDGNPQTIGDPTWEPLGAPGGPIPGGTMPDFTPPFPAYVSGHATFGAAAFRTIANYYGADDLTALLNGPLEIQSDELPGVTRSFDTLSELSEENGRSRIYLGIHWNFDDTMGRALGNQIADLTTSTMLTPVPEPSTLALGGIAAAALGWMVARRGRCHVQRVCSASNN